MSSRFLCSKIIFSLAGALVLGLSACSKDDSPTATGDHADHNMIAESQSGELSLVDLGATEVAGVRIELSGPEYLTSGYTSLSVRLFDVAGNQYLRDATVAITPIMNMEDRSHSAPVESGAQDEGTYRHSVVFVMPGTWQVNVAFTSADGDKGGNAVFALDVGQSERYAALTGSDDQRYFVSLLAPLQAVVGKQDLEVTVHTRETMMSFPPVTDLTVEIEPSMPAMGHGSPNNEQPVHVHEGHYVGKVNFIMTGDWRMDVRLKDGDKVVAETYFDLAVR